MFLPEQTVDLSFNTLAARLFQHGYYGTSMIRIQAADAGLSGQTARRRIKPRPRQQLRCKVSSR